MKYLNYFILKVRVLDKKKQSSIHKHMQISSLTWQRFDTNVSASHNKNEAPNHLVAKKEWSSVQSLAYQPRVENMKGL